jgi:hypothetical protein
MAQQKLDHPEILGFLVYQVRFGSSHGMCAVKRSFETKLFYPPMKIRLYCRVDMCRLVPIRDRNKKSLLCKFPSFINAATASLVPLVISNCTGLPVFCCSTVALLETELPYATSDTLRLTRSQPRSLLSKAILNRAKSRVLPSSSSRIRIPDMRYLKWSFLAYDTVFIPR